MKRVEYFLYLISVVILSLLISGGVPTLANNEATPSDVDEIELINDLKTSEVEGVSFNVVIPAKVTLTRDYESGGYSGIYAIYVQNNNNTNDSIEVYPESSSVELSSYGKSSVVAYIDQPNTVFDSDVTEAQGRVYVDEVVSAGRWEGKFDFKVNPVEGAVTTALLDLDLEVATPSNAAKEEIEIETDKEMDINESLVSDKEEVMIDEGEIVSDEETNTETEIMEEAETESTEVNESAETEENENKEVNENTEGNGNTEVSESAKTEEIETENTEAETEAESAEENSSEEEESESSEENEDVESEISVEKEFEEDVEDI